MISELKMLNGDFIAEDIRGIRNWLEGALHRSFEQHDLYILIEHVPFGCERFLSTSNVGGCLDGMSR